MMNPKFAGCWQQIEELPQVCQFWEDCSNALVAGDSGSAGRQNQHCDRLEAFYHACVAKLSSPVEANFVCPHGVAQVKIHYMDQHL